ncbi:MAG: DUF1917 domain-containing protein [Actinomycetota bacterium]|jgi:hypothetical protein|nr:DUF1917 domain-containing protein [Actinomycetota bacterium]
MEWDDIPRAFKESYACLAHEAPTECDHGAHWLLADRDGTGPRTDRNRAVPPELGEDQSGKWLVMVSPEEVDAVWAEVAGATRAGELGPSSKAGTEWQRQAMRASTHLICAYCEDWRDIEDLRRVLTALRRLGLSTGIASFKRDKDTIAGEYQDAGRLPNPSVWVAYAGGVEEPVRLYTKWLSTRWPFAKTELDGTNDAEVARKIEELWG